MATSKVTIDLTSHTPPASPVIVIDLTADDADVSVVIGTPEVKVEMINAASHAAVPLQAERGIKNVHSEQGANAKRRKHAEKIPSRQEVLSPSVMCNVCLEDAYELKNSGRQIMATKCGHIFCDTCIYTAIAKRRSCPMCRKKLKKNDVHPIFL